MIAYAFVILPLVAYLPFFLIETWASFNRIGKKVPSSDNYLHLTWEMTHTLLIVGINFFVWLFASVIVDVGQAVYWGLITVGALYIVRGILYIYTYYGGGSSSRLHNGWTDWLFAFTHLAIIACLLYVIIRAVLVLVTTDYSINTHLLPWMYPGLFLLVIVCTIPIARLYRVKR